MTSLIQFKPGDRWSHNGLVLRFERDLGDGLLHFQVERTGGPFQLEGEAGPRSPDSAWAVEAYAAGKLKRMPGLKGSAVRRVAAEREYDPATIANMDPGARRRVFILRGLDAFGIIKCTPREASYALARLWSEQPDKAKAFEKPDPRTVIRWLSERGEPGRRPLAEMVSMSGRVPRAARLPAELHRMMDRYAVYYWTGMGLQINDAYAKFASRLYRLNRWRQRAGREAFVLPSPETFRGKVHKRGNRQAHAAKWGSKKAASLFKAVQGQFTAARFLALGCMDHTSLDTIAAFDADQMLPVGTPWLTLLTDVKTRCVVGFLVCFEPPSIYSVMECLKRAALPKRVYADRKDGSRDFDNIFGRFDHIVVDNGKEFSGVTFEDGLTDIGTTIELAPVASPQHKAIVERFFRTLNTLLVHKLPGARLPIHQMRELGYDPRATVVLTLGEIEELIWETLRLYHLDVHTGTGFPPGLLWKRDVEAFGIPVYDDLSAFEKMLGVPEERQLSRSGIELHGLIYHDPGLVGGVLEELAVAAPVRSQRKTGSAVCRVKIKYNPVNLGAVQVWHHLRKAYVTLPCAEPEYAEGLSLWHHNQIKAAAREAGLGFSSRQLRLEARARLVAKVERLMPDAKMRQRRAMTRLLLAPKVEPIPSGVVEVQFAPSRHDGLAPIVPQIALASERSDGGLRPTRPARPKSSKAAPVKRKTAKPASSVAAFPVSTAPKTWEGFE